MLLPQDFSVREMSRRRCAQHRQHTLSCSHPLDTLHLMCGHRYRSTGSAYHKRRRFEGFKMSPIALVHRLHTSRSSWKCYIQEMRCDGAAKSRGPCNPNTLLSCDTWFSYKVRRTRFPFTTSSDTARGCSRTQLCRQGTGVPIVLCTRVGRSLKGPPNMQLPKTCGLCEATEMSSVDGASIRSEHRSLAEYKAYRETWRHG